MDANSEEAVVPDEIQQVDLNILQSEVPTETTYLEKNFWLGVVNGVLDRKSVV
jgi:hypothetical protein